MELKAYQSAALDAFARWRDALEEAERASREAIAALEKVGAPVPDIMRHYPEAAWNALERPRGIGGSPGPYVMRTDDAGRPHPPCLPQGPHRRRQDAARRMRAGAAGAPGPGSRSG